MIMMFLMIPIMMILKIPMIIMAMTKMQQQLLAREPEHKLQLLPRLGLVDNDDHDDHDNIDDFYDDDDDNYNQGTRSQALTVSSLLLLRLRYLF